jgi:hypothetical protein
VRHLSSRRSPTAARSQAFTKQTGRQLMLAAVWPGQSHFHWYRRQDSNLRPLGYELTSDSVMSMPVSQTCRPPLVPRPRHHAAFHAIRAVAPRFVHKSVHKRCLPITPADDEVRAAMMCHARRLGLLAVFAESATRAAPAPTPRCGSPPTKSPPCRIGSSRPSAQANWV